MAFPPEWVAQRTVLFSFPRRAGDWGAALAAASSAMIAAANAVNAVTPTLLLVGDREHFEAYRTGYEGEWIEIPTDDCWVRDFGPITVLRRDVPTLLDFTFNGWGGKFPAARDNAVPRQLHQRVFDEYRYQRVDLELEGGSIETDGRGTLLTTTRCLLNPNRNAGLATRQAMETALTTQLGIRRVLWLEHGELAGDDTDAHVDTLARFIDPRTIAYVRCDDPADSHFAELQRMETQLRGFTDADGISYELLPLPWCPAIFAEDDGRRLPATYANFLLSGGCVFLPQYYGGAGADAEAVRVLEAYANYPVIPVDCRAFIEQHGSLHCLTMQVPDHGIVGEKK